MADDDPAIRTVTRRTLTAFGYRVVEAVDGMEPLEVYGRPGAEIDLVLTDVMMHRVLHGDLAGREKPNPT